MSTVEYYNIHTRTLDTIEVVFVKDADLKERWNVRRADNRRLLGWLNPPTEYSTHRKAWTAHVSASAYLGDGPADEGYVLDKVPHTLYHGTQEDWSKSLSITYAQTRRAAAEALVSYLNRNQAPAVGFGRHPAVTRYPSFERRERGEIQS